MKGRHTVTIAMSLGFLVGACATLRGDRPPCTSDFDCPLHDKCTRTSADSMGTCTTPDWAKDGSRRLRGRGAPSGGQGCRKQCKKGKPCGCSCISVSKTCHK